jgi:L-threonylcarbamoyladenylate synthase
LKEGLDYAFNQLSLGKVIAIPTDTVYGLACDIFSETAIQEIYRLKGRSFDKPLTAFCKDITVIENICIDIPDEFYKLSTSFLPGPISIILKKNNSINELVTSGKKTISVRIPNNPFILELLKTYRNPLATTSANISNSSSLANSESVFKVFENQIPLVIDGGDCIYGLESTIVDLSNIPYKILREGVLKVKDIEDALGHEI